MNEICTISNEFHIFSSDFHSFSNDFDLFLMIVFHFLLIFIYLHIISIHFRMTRHTLPNAWSISGFKFAFHLVPYLVPTLWHPTEKFAAHFGEKSGWEVGGQRSSDFFVFPYFSASYSSSSADFHVFSYGVHTFIMIFMHFLLISSHFLMIFIQLHKIFSYGCNLFQKDFQTFSNN